MNRKPHLDEKFYPPDLELDENLDDEELLRRAMSGVSPMPETPLRVPLRKVPPIPPESSSDRVGEEDARELLMRALDDGSALEVFYLNEYVEGGSRSWDTTLLKRLREGEFSVQAELDLHGFNQREAIEELETFLHESCRRGLSCVRVIHGKGKNSFKDVPVLKNRVQRWLSRRRSSRYVVAYTSARPVDGGGGALYVLLRCDAEVRG